MPDIENVDNPTQAVTSESAPENEQSVVEVPTEGLEEVVEPQDDTDEIHEESVPGSQPSGAQKRITQLVAQKKSEQEARIRAEVEREYYKGLAEGRTTPQEKQSLPPPEPQQMQAPVAPNLDQYESFDEYEKAKDDYYIQMAEKRMAQKFVQQQQVVAQQQKATAVQIKLQSAAQSDPAFAEIYGNKAIWDTLPISPVMAEVLTSSDIPQDIIKWVHNNRQEAQRIATMSPIMVARELGIIEAQLKATPKPPPPKKVSAAPAPISTVSASTPAEVDEDSLPMEEYYRRRSKQIYGR